MRKKIVAGNWKMNTTLQEGVALANDLKNALAGKKVNCDVVVCTPFISVAAVADAVKGSVIGVGAEDCSANDKGAFFYWSKIRDSWSLGAPSVSWRK